MDAQSQAHRQRIVDRFTADFNAKYEAGQNEHGGVMCEKPGMLSHAIAEALDLIAYLYTLQEQQDAGRTITGRD